tara:strand:+ start:7295 stop:7870 length:576 start_codon:yes stop_codon:yes gene_type:complete
MTFNEEQLTHWMQLVRSTQDGIEAFWPSQIKSKVWIANNMPEAKSCVIFGCWYGVLADILQIENTICVDIKAEYLEWCAKKYPVAQNCLSEYRYDDVPDVVINTITEHISQEVYDKWFDNIPVGTYYVIQGNNDFGHKDHIRACKDLNMFASINRMNHNFDFLDEITYEGPWNMEEDKPTYFKRFMGIGIK